MNPTIEKMLYNLEKNNIKPFYLETKGEVVGLVSRLLGEGDTVAVGGSDSLFESGVIEFLRNGKYIFLDRHKIPTQERRDINIKSMNADVYLCSSNAITENGELYNVDGNSNRISAIAFGPKSVIMIVGKNKIVKNLDEAVRRIKTVTAPELCKLRGRNTYCKETGYCISIANKDTNMTTGCDTPERICCSFLVTGKQRFKNRIKIILVNEDLGI